MNTSFSYYEILGVPQTATSVEVKAAYRAAMLKYHPDVNSAPNAQRLTEIINDAYAVLSDEGKRVAYDKSLVSGHPMCEPGEGTGELWDFFGCDGCGQVDVHIRFATFFRVFSIIFYSQMNGTGGILCPECRSKFAISTALFSAFLGPWGFPWGIFYTLRALFASLRGGEQPHQQNAQLLRHQGIAFLQRGFINEARTALTASLRFEKNQGVTDLLGQPVFTVSTIYPGRGWLKGQTVAAALFAVPPLLVILLIIFFGAGSVSNTSGLSSPSVASEQQDAQYAQIKAMIEKCRTADDRSKDARTPYDACNAALKWLDDDLKQSPAASEDHQNYAILADGVRVSKAIAAARLGWTDESKQLEQQSDTDLKNLRDNGATSKVRNTARNYYDCAVNSMCSK